MRVFGTKGWLRTCKRCGATWFVTKDQRRRPPNRLQVNGARLTRDSAQAMDMELRRQRYFEALACRQCGSTKFDEKRQR